MASSISPVIYIVKAIAMKSTIFFPCKALSPYVEYYRELQLEQESSTFMAQSSHFNVTLPNE